MVVKWRFQELFHPCLFRDHGIEAIVPLAATCAGAPGKAFDLTSPVATPVQLLWKSAWTKPPRRNKAEPQFSS